MLHVLAKFRMLHISKINKEQIMFLIGRTRLRHRFKEFVSKITNNLSKKKYLPSNAEN